MTSCITPNKVYLHSSWNSWTKYWICILLVIKFESKTVSTKQKSKKKTIFLHLCSIFSQQAKKICHYPTCYYLTTRLWGHYPTLPYSKLKNHYSLGPVKCKHKTASIPMLFDQVAKAKRTNSDRIRTKRFGCLLVKAVPGKAPVCLVKSCLQKATSSTTHTGCKGLAAVLKGGLHNVQCLGGQIVAVFHLKKGLVTKEG